MLQQAGLSACIQNGSLLFLFPFLLTDDNTLLIFLPYSSSAYQILHDITPAVFWCLLSLIFLMHLLVCSGVFLHMLHISDIYSNNRSGMGEVRIFPFYHILLSHRSYILLVLNQTCVSFCLAYYSIFKQISKCIVFIHKNICIILFALYFCNKSNIFS